MLQTPLRYWLTAYMLFCFSVAHAQEKTALPPDLIELLGELNDDDQASLEVAMQDIENKPAPATKSPVAKSQDKVDVGAKK